MSKQQRKEVVNMNKLITVNVEQFKSLTMEDCLNYIPEEKLENVVKSHVLSVLKLLKDKKYASLSMEDKMQFFLQQLLLKITANNIWITSRDKSNLDQKYLYTVIRKHLFLIDPSFFN